MLWSLLASVCAAVGVENVLTGLAGLEPVDDRAGIFTSEVPCHCAGGADVLCDSLSRCVLTEWLEPFSE
jgi:hypothetical protein